MKIAAPYSHHNANDLPFPCAIAAGMSPISTAIMRIPILVTSYREYDFPSVEIEYSHSLYGKRAYIVVASRKVVIMLMRHIKLTPLFFRSHIASALSINSEKCVLEAIMVLPSGIAPIG